MSPVTLPLTTFPYPHSSHASSLLFRILPRCSLLIPFSLTAHPILPDCSSLLQAWEKWQQTAAQMKAERDALMRAMKKFLNQILSKA